MVSAVCFPPRKGNGLLYLGLAEHCHLYDQLGINILSDNGGSVNPAQIGVHMKSPFRSLQDFYKKKVSEPKSY